MILGVTTCQCSKAHYSSLHESWCYKSSNHKGGKKTTLNSFLQILLAHNHTFSLLHTSSKNTQRYSLCVWIYATKASRKNTTEDHKSIRLRKGKKQSCSRQQLTKRSIQDALPRLNFPNVTNTNFLLARRRRRNKKKEAAAAASSKESTKRCCCTKDKTKDSETRGTERMRKLQNAQEMICCVYTKGMECGAWRLGPIHSSIHPSSALR